MTSKNVFQCYLSYGFIEVFGYKLSINVVCDMQGHYLFAVSSNTEGEEFWAYIGEIVSYFSLSKTFCGMPQASASRTRENRGAFSICTEKPVVPVKNQMEQTFPLEIFRKKWKTFRGIPLLPFFTEMIEKSCTICLVPLVPRFLARFLPVKLTTWRPGHLCILDVSLARFTQMNS